ncbi:MAG: hypothetical protein H6834_06800 [Planctomycetes bacterium]|nr:hypothetical protein [Planctomycetota bacterium]
MDESLQALRRAASSAWMRDGDRSGAVSEWAGFARTLLESPRAGGHTVFRDGWGPAFWATLLACIVFVLFLRRLRAVMRAPTRPSGIAVLTDAVAPPRRRRGLILIWLLAGACAIPSAWIAIQRVDARKAMSLRSQRPTRWNLLQAYAAELDARTQRVGLADLPERGLLVIPAFDTTFGQGFARVALESFVRRGGTLLVPIVSSEHGELFGFTVPTPRQVRRPDLLRGDWLSPDEPEAFSRPPEVVFDDAGQGRAPVRGEDGSTAFIEHPLGLGRLVFVADRGREWFSDEFLYRAVHRARQESTLAGRVHLVARLLERWSGPGREVTFLDATLPRTSWSALLGFGWIDLSIATMWFLALFAWSRPAARRGFEYVASTGNVPADLRAQRSLGDELLRDARIRLGLSVESPPGKVIDGVSGVTGMSRVAIRRIFFPSTRGATQRRERWRRDYLELRRRLSR